MITPRSTPDRRVRSAKALVKRATDAAYSEGVVHWPDDMDRMHIWSAGFIQGYLARRPAKRRVIP